MTTLSISHIMSAVNITDFYTDEYTPWQRLAAAIVIRAINDLGVQQSHHNPAEDLDAAREFLLSDAARDLVEALGMDLRRGLERLGIVRGQP